MSSKITASDVKNLREKTGAGMMEAKSALSEAGGDTDRALDILRKKGQLRAGRKTARAVGQGIIDAYIHGLGRIGVILEVNCETDFVARSAEFKNLVHDIALHVAASSPLYVSRQEVPSEVVEKEKEIYAEAAKSEGKSGEITKKIVEGRVEKYYQEVCLLEQPFVKDQDINIQELVNQKIAIIGENIKIRRFTRYVLGE
ncbi:MAG: translation elongation factor Ts [Candidatus Doudnabacteria bacterium]|nr:translation elongation factor Ts [bacterium]MDZ4243784.1 translation elongation factor Ts [Candidatus Doudnabacteria bacterium]